MGATPTIPKYLLRPGSFMEIPPSTSYPEDIAITEAQPIPCKKSEIKKQADDIWNTDFYNNGFRTIKSTGKYKK